MPNVSKRLIERLRRDGLLIGRKKPVSFRRLRCGFTRTDIDNWKWEVVDADGFEILGSVHTAESCLKAEKLGRQRSFGLIEVYPKEG